MIRLVLTTFADGETAARIVKTLVSEKWAACGTILPGARSIYLWNGALEENEEAVVLFKIAASNQEAFSRRLTELHPYEVPEILALSPVDWNEAYARWVVSAGGE